MADTLKFAAFGLDHRHIFGMSQGMMSVGAEFAGFWSNGEPQPYAGFVERFAEVPRFENRLHLLEDESVSLILIGAMPAYRAELAIEAMRHGKDVMVDKPGCITLDELSALRTAAAETGRIWSVNFSERFEVPASTIATDYVKQGRIGKVIQTLGMGPHRLNAPTRPDWFFDRKQYGGILTDIASHQIDQFLHYSGANEASIEHSAVGNFANPTYPNFEDFGEINLSSEQAQGYIRVDWYTPDALPTWGDGRLFILGTEGTIELRKYVDLNGREGTDHLFMFNGNTCEHVNCADAGLPYFAHLANDIRDRTETACAQAHTFRVMELALNAQTQASQRGTLAGLVT